MKMNYVKEIFFSTPGHPIGKQDYRTAGIRYSKKGMPYGIRYTTQKVKDYMEKIRLCFVSKYKVFSKEEQRNRYKLTLFVDYIGRLDIDKIANAYMDALTKIVWANDCYVDELHVSKWRVKTPEQEKVICCIELIPYHYW